MVNRLFGRGASTLGQWLVGMVFKSLVVVLAILVMVAILGTIGEVAR